MKRIIMLLMVCLLLSMSFIMVSSACSCGDVCQFTRTVVYSPINDIHCSSCSGTSFTQTGSVTKIYGGPDQGCCYSYKYTQHLICNNCACIFNYTIGYEYYYHLWEDTNDDGIADKCHFCGYS